MRKRRKRRIVIAAVIVIVAALGGWWAYRYHGPVGPTAVYRGVTYGCEEPPESGEMSGLVHWVCADLNDPAVSLFVTPGERGNHYKLEHTSSQVSTYGLAAAVNGTLFNSDSTLIRLPGDNATSVETVVADHVVDHVDPNTYLLWWDDGNVAHLETTKPPSPAVLAAARWGIGGQVATLVGGKVSTWAGRATDRRTIVAADPATKRVWLACFDHASDRAAGQWAADHGAILGVTVDGGTSTAMALGPGAKGVRSGTVAGNWRPVATVIGVKVKTQ